MSENNLNFLRNYQSLHSWLSAVAEILKWSIHPEKYASPRKEKDFFLFFQNIRFFMY